ncbi:MAG: hypothetical protein ACM3TN_17545 [Alphaproteobacteria bacterium]
MTQRSSSDETIDSQQRKTKQMLKVLDIIQMAQQAGRKELLSIKAGLSAAFGDDWREFKPPAQGVVASEQETSSAKILPWP